MGVTTKCLLPTFLFAQQKSRLLRGCEIFPSSTTQGEPLKNLAGRPKNEGAADITVGLNAGVVMSDDRRRKEERNPHREIKGNDMALTKVDDETSRPRVIKESKREDDTEPSDVVIAVGVENGTDTTPSIDATGRPGSPEVVETT